MPKTLTIEHHSIALLHRARHPKTIGFTASPLAADERLQTLMNYLKKNNFKVQLCEKSEQLQRDKIDFVLAVGGDGTVLDAAQTIGTLPMLGLNDSPETSCGKLCSATFYNFTELFDKIIHNQAKIQKIQRLEVIYNGEPIPTPILNDCLFTSCSPARVSKYRLTYDSKTESQFSSGLWIATAAGSTGGFHSAGGEILELTDKRIKFLVREPCLNNVMKFSIFSGEITQNSDFSLQCITPDLRLYCDGGLRTLKLRENDLLTFRPHPLPWMRVTL